MLDLILQGCERTQHPLGTFSASQAQTSFVITQYNFPSVKNHFSLKMNIHARERNGAGFLPELLWAEFMAVQDPHFCCHKPNRPLRPAHFHIRFPAIDSCVERVAQECRWMRHLLSFIFSDTVQSGALRVSWTHEQMVLSGLEDYTEGKDNLQESPKFSSIIDQGAK